MVVLNDKPEGERTKENDPFGVECLSVAISVRIVQRAQTNSFLMVKAPTPTPLDFTFRAYSGCVNLEETVAKLSREFHLPGTRIPVDPPLNCLPLPA